MSGLSEREAPASHKPPVSLILRCLMGAALGTWADTYLLKRPARFSRTTIYAGVGVLTTLAWETRNITGAMARSAANEIGKVRDERWLEMNPIDYA